MFKKPNRFQEYPLDYKKYKTPDHFEGLIFKGFIGTSIKDDKTNVYLNLIKIYKNDVHHFNIGTDDDIYKMEIQETLVGFTTIIQLPQYLEVWVVMTSQGLSGLIYLKDKVPYILISNVSENDKGFGKIAPINLVKKNLKYLSQLDFKSSKFIRLNNREKLSLLKKVKTVLLKEKVNELAKNEELNVTKILCTLPNEYALYETNNGVKDRFNLMWDGFDVTTARLVINEDFDNGFQVKDSRLVSDTLNTFEIDVINNSKVCTYTMQIATVKVLNNKEALSILRKGVADE